MLFTQLGCREFSERLASKDPVPGGGGACAMAGALGTALGTMVGNLTVGKKKYKDVEADILVAMEKAESLRIRLLELVDGDAEVFEPLSKAYGIPKDDPSRAAVMESALRLAVSVPLEIMTCCCRAIELHEALCKKGSAIALSDVGVGALFCRAALEGASLNVFINTKYMTDTAYAAETDKKADALLSEYGERAEAVYKKVAARLRRAY